jgi:hypothetical protein
METARALHDQWSPIINSHKNSKNIEIEMRFGRKSGSGFDTNVGKAAFEKVMRALTKYGGWEKKTHSKSTVYYFPESKRLTIDDDTEEQVGVVKRRVKVDDFHITGAPFDVRLGVATETPFEYDGEETSTEQKTKERWSFVRKNLSIDMTIVKGDPDDKDADDDTNFQIELEIVKPSAVGSRDELFALLYKIFCVMKCM